jgi:hypothetical protein
MLRYLIVNRFGAVLKYGLSAPDAECMEAHCTNTSDALVAGERRGSLFYTLRFKNDCIFCKTCIVV